MSGAKSRGLAEACQAIHRECVAASPVCLVIWSIWSVRSVLFVWLNKTNQIDQMNQTDEIDQMDQTDQINRQASGPFEFY